MKNGFTCSKSVDEANGIDCPDADLLTMCFQDL